MEYLKKHFNQAVITFHLSISLHKIPDLDRLHNSLAGIAMAGGGCLPFLALKLSHHTGADRCLWLFAEWLVNQIKQTPFPAEYSRGRNISTRDCIKMGGKYNASVMKKRVDKQLYYTSL